MKILHIAKQSRNFASGVAIAVKGYCEHEKELADIALFSLGARLSPNGVREFTIVDYPSISELPEGFNTPDLVVFNEIYKPEYIRLYKECIHRSIPYIVIPHGCLNYKAQRRHWLKKKFGNLFFYKHLLASAEAIEYLSDQEKKDSIYRQASSFVTGNGVEIPNLFNIKEHRNIVFIGRYDIKTKGLDILISVCEAHRKWFRDNNIKLICFGRANGNEQQELRTLAKEKHIADIVQINGPIYDDEKLLALQSAKLFIAPSRHEGAPLCILEALSMGTPCIASEGTNFAQYIEANNCGHGTGLDIDSIFIAIKDAYFSESYDEMRKNARFCAERDYSWNKISLETLNFYKTLLD